MAEIKPAQLATIANLKRQAIYNAIRRGNIIANSAGLVDTQNKNNSQWLRSHGLSEKDVISGLAEIQKKQSKPQKKKSISNPLPKMRKKIEKKQVEVEAEKINTIQSYIEIKPEKTENKNNESKDIDEIDFENITGLPAKMMKLNLKQLVMKYGGPMLLNSWSLILQRLMSASEKDQKMQERRLELIEKDFAVSRLFKYIEDLSSRLFDYTESSPVDFISLVKSDAENLELKIKTKMRHDISILIKDTKENINRELENLKKKYEKIKIDDSTYKS